MAGVMKKKADIKFLRLFPWTSRKEGSSSLGTGSTDLFFCVSFSTFNFEGSSSSRTAGPADGTGTGTGTGRYYYGII